MSQWLVIRIDDQQYAIDVAAVQEIASGKCQSISPLPSSPDYLEGMTSLRGTVIPVLDLRTLLGMPSLTVETNGIIGILNTREQDHVRWLKELENAVAEEREFTLASCPHKCAFGKWYDTLMADPQSVERFTNGDIALDSVLDRFDSPHKRIHALASSVMERATSGRRDDAFELIRNTRNTDLAAMITLFDEARTLITNLRTSMIIVLVSGDIVCGLQVDAVDSVMHQEADAIDHLDANLLKNEFIFATTQHPKSDDMILLLQANKLLSKTADTCAVIA